MDEVWLGRRRVRGLCHRPPARGTAAPDAPLSPDDGGEHSPTDGVPTPGGGGDGPCGGDDRPAVTRAAGSHSDDCSPPVFFRFYLSATFTDTPIY